MNSNGQLTEGLANSEIFRDYERAFTETTGLPLALRGIETWPESRSAGGAAQRFERTKY